MGVKPFIVTPNDYAAELDIVGEHVTVLASGEATQGYEIFLQRGPDGSGPPPHSHPWDEAPIVVDGEAEFRLGVGEWIRAGSGSVQLLPKGVPHAIRVPEGIARIIQVSIGAPYDAFARDMARLMAAAAPLEEIVEVAGRHGVRLGPHRLAAGADPRRRRGEPLGVAATSGALRPGARPWVVDG